MAIARKGIGPSRTPGAVATSTAPLPTQPGVAVTLPQPSYQKVDVSQTRAAFGSMLTGLLRRTLYPSKIYSQVIDHKSNNAVVKLLQKFLTKSKLHATLTKMDIAGYGEGTLFSFSHEFPAKQFKNLGQAKKAFMNLYKDYLKDMSLNDPTDSNTIVVGIFMIAPMIFLTLYGNHSMFISVTSQNTIKLGWALDKVDMAKVFRSINDSYTEAIVNIEAGAVLTDAQLRKMLKMVLYYVTAHKLSTT